jgi:hypothetical protein
MRIPFPGHSTAFEVDADYLEGTTGCTCLLCRPRGALLSFVSRDNLGLSGGRPAHRFSRQRLNHQFTAVRQADAAWMQAPKVERLKLKNHP